MRVPRAATIVALLVASLAEAQVQYLVNELSFGHSGRISPEGSAPNAIPNFDLSGSPTQPTVLSNKVILTPPAPGNQRASIWSLKPLTHRTWTADVEFRSTGPDRSGGNLNIWLARDGRAVISSSSIYTVGIFDGLALVVDTHGGSGGMVRGFLNDGSTDYKGRQSIDDLAFGHCLYPYRNLGRPSQIKLRQTQNMFRVEVDGRLCFESDKVRIPSGYAFGITAATPDNPDSMEVFKMVVMSDLDQVIAAQDSQKQQQQQQQQQQKQQSRNQGQGDANAKAAAGATDDLFDDSIPDADAELFVTSTQQFVDLHNRLQSITHHVATLFRVLSKQAQADERRQEELSQLVTSVRDDVRRLQDAVGMTPSGNTRGGGSDLQARLASLEREVKGLKTELHQRVMASEHSLRGYLSDHHATLSEAVRSGLGTWSMVSVVVGVQVIIALGYVVYKRRRNSSPKKYL